MGTHPDLTPRMAANFKVVPVRSLAGAAQDVMVPLPDTDSTSGHGTHVAGIVASTGAATGGRARGAAPGAGIYAFGAGEGASIVVASAAASFDWVIRNHDSVTPPIRVVTNSYGSVGAFDPNAIINRLTNLAVAEGLVVVFAAGNGDTLGNGGDGTVDRTTGYSKNPTPGVVSVANFDDAGTGTRDGVLASSSSRGLASDAATWPDVSAPGTSVWSTLDATGSLSWASKSLDLAFAPLGTEGNPFGNAINQHSGVARFRFGGVTSTDAPIDYILYLKPIAIYNAHRNAFATTAGAATSVSPAELQQARFYWDGPAAGPMRPLDEAGATVTAGDAIVVTKGANGGTGNPVRFQVTSPAGTSKTVHVKFPCEDNCEATIDLAGLFAGEPADGTWILSPGLAPQAGGDAIMDAANPLYVQMSGTSMAAPHVAGVAALVLDADGTLTPAQVEDVLQDTAYKFAFGAAYAADPQNVGGTSSFDKGAGLVDARAAVLAALA